MPMRQEHFVATLVTAFLVGGGLFLFYFGWDDLTTLQRLEQRSAVTEGRVIAKATRALSRGGQSSTLVVEYQPAGHPVITKTFDVDGPTYRAAVASGKARVTYHPEEPAISLITKFAALPFQVLVGLGVVMVIAGVFCAWHVLRSGKRLSGARSSD